MVAKYYSTGNQKQAAKPAKHYDNIPSEMKQEIGSYTLIHDRFSKVYTKYSLKKTTINGWKERCKKNDLRSIGKRGRPSSVDDKMLKKIKDVIIGSRLASIVISRKMVVAIGTGVVKANEPKILREFGGSLELTEGRARNVLKGMD